jgi:DNA mismatch endonuclease, patch repair protein
MTDIWTPEKRSEVMAKIRGITKPERQLRASLTSHGIRGFKVNAKVGKIRPDFIFPEQKIAIFVDGCFWHGCPHCYVQPKSNVKYWKWKLKINQQRDKRQERNLRKAGWSVIRIWECQIRRDLSRQPTKILRVLHARELLER